MQLTLCPLFSGSSGNSVYVACGGVKLLVDAGVSATRVEANLREIGVDIREIDAILVTHEHVDHVRGLGDSAVFYRLFRCIDGVGIVCGFDGCVHSNRTVLHYVAVRFRFSVKF